MVQMIVWTEIFLIWKHGVRYGLNQDGSWIFSHAYFTPLNKIYLSIILTCFLFLLAKIYISDFINLRKNSQI